MPLALAERLLSRHAGAPRDPAALASLAAALRARLDAARAAWPDVDLADEVFVDALAARVGEGDVAGSLAALCTDDLYLACACARGDARAITAFERRYQGELAAAFRQLAVRGSDPADLRQQLFERLFIAQGGRPPKIAEYGGRGSLRAWLKIAATRLRIDRERVKGDHRDNFTDDDRLAALGAGDDPELQYLKQHYREQFRAAFVAALAGLDAKERALLRLNAIEGLSATDIARMYNVHRATGKRWLADARDNLVAATQRLLVAQLGDRAVGLASVVRLIRSDLDVSLARHLK